MGAEFGKIGGRKAGADLSAYQYHYVMIDSSGVVQVANAQTGGLGILMNKPVSGAACEIAGPGEIVPVHCGAASAAGDVAMVETGDPGKLIKATDGLVVVGTFLEVTAGADGTRSDMLICTPHICSDVSVEGVANVS